MSGVEGAKVSKHDGAPVASLAEPLPQTPDEVATAQQRLRLLQWAIPASTGLLLVVSALACEQQRPSEVGRRVRRRLTEHLPG